MKRPSIIVAILLLGGGALPVRADVYTYVGSNKVVVLTNLRPQGQPAEVLVVEARAEPLDGAPLARRPPGPHRSDFDALIDAAAQAFSIDSELIHAVISVESGYMVQARSPRGAAGLMQLMPETAKEYGARDPFDPAQNINGGARYLKYLLDKYDNRLETALAAYNAGEKALARYGGKVPPFRETLRYVELVRERYLRNQRTRPAP
jgi:soluble lytic murein transglycosylase-like protein